MAYVRIGLRGFDIPPELFIRGTVFAIFMMAMLAVEVVMMVVEFWDWTTHKHDLMTSYRLCRYC